MSYQISPSSEIKFTPTGQSSCNTEVLGYTDDNCFHEKFLCTGLRRLQVLGGADDDEELRLSIQENGVEVETIDYTQTSNGTPSSGGVTSAITLPALSTWVSRSISPALVDWTTGVAPNVTLPGTGGLGVKTSEDIYCNYAFVVGNTYEITIDYTRVVNSGSGNPRTSVLTIMDSGFNIVENQSNADSAGANSITLTFVALSGYSRVGFYHSSAANVTITIDDIAGDQTTPVIPAVPGSYYLNSVSFSPYDYSLCNKYLSFKVIQKAVDPEDEVELFYSDTVYFPSVWANSNHSGRVVIQFRSIQNCDGLIYDDSSPYFSIEIDGQFVEPDFKTTEKVMDLTEMVLNTASTLKEGTKLIINDAPRYMHRKILGALQHAASGSVIVNDTEISLDGGSYELGGRPQTYKPRPAEIVLTHKYSYIHNVI